MLIHTLFDQVSSPVFKTPCFSKLNNPKASEPDCSGGFRETINKNEEEKRDTSADRCRSAVQVLSASVVCIIDPNSPKRNEETSIKHALIILLSISDIKKADSQDHDYIDEIGFYLINCSALS